MPTSTKRKYTLADDQKLMAAVGDLIAEKNLSVSLFEVVTAADALWFEEHPGEDTLIRPYCPGEFREFLDYVPDATLVKQVVPGLRTRHPLVLNTVGGVQ